MILSKDELFRLMGLSDNFEDGSSLMLENENGALRATARWGDDTFSADVTAAVDGEASEAIVVLEGRYVADEDGFDLTCEDHRDEASAPDDPRSVANAYRMLTNEMHALA